MICEGLLWQKVATVSAHEQGNFPKNIQQNIADEGMRNAVEIMLMTAYWNSYYMYRASHVLVDWVLLTCI